ncbi:MAG: pyrroline-5-carboxylate reductase [Candidatus Omnitrophota bacterium]
MKKIGIIGYGNMGSAIAERIKDKYKVSVFDKDKKKTEGLKAIAVASNVYDLAKNVDVIILAVKPQDFSNLLAEVKDSLGNKLIISIAAGITTKSIAESLPDVKTRIIRAMPNLLGKIGEGATFLYRSLSANEEDIDFAEELFSNLGKTWRIAEGRMKFATAVSGTGPAICCYQIESWRIDIRRISDQQKRDLIDYLQRGARAGGFNQEDAKKIAEDITEGVIHLLDSKDLTPQMLREQITSEGGTTEAALEALNDGLSIEDAIKAAVRRAEELSQG